MMFIEDGPEIRRRKLEQWGRACVWYLTKDLENSRIIEINKGRDPFDVYQIDFKPSDRFAERAALKFRDFLKEKKISKFIKNPINIKLETVPAIVVENEFVTIRVISNFTIIRGQWDWVISYVAMVQH